MEDHLGVVVDNFSLRGNSGMILERLDVSRCQALNKIRPYDLIVLQYGLNVVSDSVMNYGWYSSRMVKVINHIQLCFPEADILMLGVSDRSRQDDGEFETMPAVLALLHAQRQAAKKAGVPFWNVFGAMGGENSMVRFVELNWASKDYTHLSFRGGREIADALLKALLSEKDFMMKRRKWLISLVVLGVIMGFSVPKPKAGINGDVSLDSLAVRDTVALPPLSYSMKVGKDTLILPDSSKAWNNFFNELDSLRAGKDTAITIVQLGDSHIQAGHLSGRVMRLFQQAFGNAGRGWIAPFKLSKTNEPDDYFIKSVAKDWIAGRCIQHVRKTPIGIGGIGIKSVSPSINFDVVITPNNGAGYEFNEAILYRGEKSMPMLPAGALKDSVQTFRADTVCVPGVLADTFRISCLTDTLQLQSTRRKEGTNTLRPASSFTNLYYGLTLKNGGRGILYHSIGVNGAMYVNYTDEAYIRQLALLKPSLLIISMGTNETFGRRFNTDEFSGQIEAFLAIVKKELPNTAILLTTPPECYRRVRSGKQRTYVRNDNTEQAARAIRNDSEEKKRSLAGIYSLRQEGKTRAANGIVLV